MPLPSELNLRTSPHVPYAHAGIEQRTPRADTPPAPARLLLRFAAELKALGRPFPRVLELGSGPGELAATVLHEVPGLRLVALELTDALHDHARERLANKAGRLTFVTRDFTTAGWAEGLGQFDAVITTQVDALRQYRRSAALYAQVRQLMLPGGLFLCADPVRGHGGALADPEHMGAHEQLDAFEEAGWTRVDRRPVVDGWELLRARR